MKRTTTPPTKPGWYWRRTRFGDCEAPHPWCTEAPSMVVVGKKDGQLSWHHYPATVSVLADEWSDGPIPTPEERHGTKSC